MKNKFQNISEVVHPDQLWKNYFKHEQTFCVVKTIET